MADEGENEPECGAEFFWLHRERLMETQHCQLGRIVVHELRVERQYICNACVSRGWGEGVGEWANHIEMQGLHTERRERQRKSKKKKEKK